MTSPNTAPASSRGLAQAGGVGKKPPPRGGGRALSAARGLDEGGGNRNEAPVGGEEQGFFGGAAAHQPIAGGASARHVRLAPGLESIGGLQQPALIEHAQNPALVKFSPADIKDEGAK